MVVMVLIIYLTEVVCLLFLFNCDSVFDLEFVLVRVFFRLMAPTCAGTVVWSKVSIERVTGAPIPVRTRHGVAV